MDTKHDIQADLSALIGSIDFEINPELEKILYELLNELIGYINVLKDYDPPDEKSRKCLEVNFKICYKLTNNDIEYRDN